MRHARKDYERIQDPAGLIPQDEPVFLIRGQDKSGPHTVRTWAANAEQMGCDPAIVAHAREHAKLMEAWQLCHGSKVPDMPKG